MDKRWEELFALRNKSDLSTIKKTLEELGFSKTFKIINVVGTNGKGSSVKMIAKALRKSGKKVGTFTSPHLVLPNERIEINGVDISDKDFFDIYNRFNGSQFFSILFVVAMIYFQEQGVDYAVVEAGVGGRRDSTNAVDGDYGILTSIGLDHINYLGNTHQSVFNDKVGIANPGMKFFIPSVLPEDVNPGNYKVINNEAPTYIERNFKLCKSFLKENFDIDINEWSFPKGRSEIRTINDQECIFDVSHNLDGIKAELEYLQVNNINFDEVVITLAKKKELDGILELFEGKKMRYFKPNDTFRDFDFEEIKDIKTYKPSAKTLFIGSFRLIGALYE